jgi:hypothetical protein
MYVLQDANYNVVALVATNGNLLEQYAYEPYGTLAARDDFGNHAVNRVGHQGLFFERFDGTYADGTLDIAPPGAALGPIGIGLYFARNRFYGPGIGRWTTADPNETGLPIVAAMVRNGPAPSTLLGFFNARGMYSDGMNLYLSFLANPVNRSDASGLQVAINVNEQLIANLVLGMLLTAFAQVAAVSITQDGGLSILKMGSGASSGESDAGGRGDRGYYSPEWECEWGLAWCNWAVTTGYKGTGPNDWHPELDFAACTACYTTCELSGIWPNVGKCKLGGRLYDRERGTTWPDNDTR